MTQSTGCINKVRFYQRRNIYLILFKVIAGLFVSSPAVISCKSRKQNSTYNFTTYTVAALQWFYGFTIGEHEELLEQLSNILATLFKTA